MKKIKVNFWKLLSKMGKIRELIEVVVELVKYIFEKTVDPKLELMATRIKKLLREIFGGDFI
ncbi:MAG TPA: hypothetical protein VMV77_16735 [Bacteroidales bacterium]|nr:hypothetical protein [Bacteroidales bacterium]